MLKNKLIIRKSNKIKLISNKKGSIIMTINMISKNHRKKQKISKINSNKTNLKNTIRNHESNIRKLLRNNEIEKHLIQIH